MQANRTLRQVKAVLVAAVALFAALVAIGNVTDYGSNFAFVQHVLSMDTTFPDNALRWRAIHAPWLHYFAYWAIIAAEALTAVACAAGAWRLWRAAGDAEAFSRTKGLAYAGLGLGVLLWFTGFMTIGGEWFAMWQSQVWNGQQAAFRFVVCLGFVLLLLAQPERED